MHATVMPRGSGAAVGQEGLRTTCAVCLEPSSSPGFRSSLTSLHAEKGGGLSGNERGDDDSLCPHSRCSSG